MINGYVTIPTEFVDRINNSNENVITIADDALISQMDNIVRTRKPIYIEGVKIGDYSVNAQLAVSANGDMWALGYSLLTENSLIPLKPYILITKESDSNITVLRGG